MFQSFSKKQKILFFIIIVISVALSLFRILTEEPDRHYFFAIKDTDLYRYYTAEQSPLSFDQYTQKLKAQGLKFIIASPLSISDFIKTKQCHILQATATKTVIQCNKNLWFNNRLQIRPHHIKTNKTTLTLTFHYYFQDIIHRPFQYMPPAKTSIPIIFLQKPFYKETIDGWYSKQKIFYSKNETPKNLAQAIPLFQPYAFINNADTISLQYKRAFWERKNKMLMIPFFYRLVKKDTPFSLIHFIQNTTTLIKNPNSLFNNFQSNWGFTGLKILLIFVLSGFFFNNIPLMILFSLLSVLIDTIPQINNFYIVFVSLLFFYVLSSYTLKKIQIPLSEFFIFLLVGGLTISGLGSHELILRKIYIIHFISFILIFAFLILLALLYKNKIMYMTQNVALIELLFIIVLPIIMYLFLSRSNNFAHINPFELQFRNFLDHLFFIRPRLKETFFFYPLISFTMLSYKHHYIDKKISSFLLSIGLLGIISSFNTILHFQSFFIIAFTRFVFDFILGTSIGFIGFYFLNFSTHIYKVLKS